jgi:hypothetical protein
MTLLCRLCGTEHVERTTPRRLLHKRDYETCKGAGFKMLAEDGKARVVLIPRFSCNCQYRARIRLLAEDMLVLVHHPYAHQEQRRREGLAHYRERAQKLLGASPRPELVAED